MAALAVLVTLLGALVAALALSGPAVLKPELTAPSRVEVQPQDKQAKASWELDFPASSFQVEYASSPDFADAQVEKVTDDPAELSALTPGSTYFLRVVALDDQGKKSIPSRTVRFTTSYSATPPKTTATTSSSTAMKASWKAVAKGLRYETQLDSEPSFDDARTKDTKKTSVRFTKLKPGTTYYVRSRVVDGDGVGQSEWSEPVSDETARYEPLGVGTYNVLKWRRNNWSARRGPVADLIKNSNVDVVGLQEATPSHIPGGPPQFVDIVSALGSDWALTRTDGAATGETRTVYNRKQVTLISEGYQTIAGSSRFRGIARYVAYAVFEQKSTGKRFFFVNTHFTPGRGRAEAANRASSAQQLVATVQRANTEGLPVIAVGDFNTGLPRSSGNSVYRTITGSGLIDPLVDRGGKRGQAEKLVDANLKTVNGLRRVAPRRPSPALVDHIFVSRMRVSQWQVAANLDGAGRFIGTIPSDHNLVRATVWLP